MSLIHPDILEGEGTKEFPFLLKPCRYWFSTTAQRETIRRIYGEGVYKPHGGRRYYESPRGRPKNKDLCEHVLLVNGTEVSCWFDLSNVTQFETDSTLMKGREGLREMMVNDPASQRVQAQMLKQLGQGANSQVKPSETNRTMEGLSISQPIKIPPCTAGKGIKLCHQILKERFRVENPQKLTVLVSESILKVDLGENRWVYIDTSSLRSPHPLLPNTAVWLVLWNTDDPEEAEKKGLQALGVGSRKSGCLGMVALGIGLVGLGAFIWVVIRRVA